MFPCSSSLLTFFCGRIERGKKGRRTGSVLAAADLNELLDVLNFLRHVGRDVIRRMDEIVELVSSRGWGLLFFCYTELNCFKRCGCVRTVRVRISLRSENAKISEDSIGTTCLACLVMPASARGDADPDVHPCVHFRQIHFSI